MSANQIQNQLHQLRRSLKHHTPTAEQVERIAALHQAAKDFGESLITFSDPSREQSLAITALENSLMWAIKGVILNARTPA